MESEQLELLRKCCKDESSYGTAKKLFMELLSKWKKAEKNLSLLEAAIRNDYDSILITELDLEEPGPKIVYVNDGFTKLTGYTKDEVIGKTPRILQGPKTERATLDKLKKALREGKSFFGQAINYRKDGTEFVNQWDIHPLYNQKGEITHWVSYQHDITDRKRAEFSFNETRAEFDSLAEFSKRTLVDFDKEGNIIGANKSFRNLTGYDKGELEHKKIWEIIDDKHEEKFKNGLTELNGKDFSVTFLRKNNVPVETKVHAKLFELKDGVIIRAVIDNISLQKRVLKALEKRNFDFSRLVENKSDFTYGLDISDPDNLHFAWLSEGFRTLTGLNPNQFITKGGWEKLIHPDDFKKVKKHINKVLSGATSTEEYRLVIADDKTVNVLDYAKPDKDPVTGDISLITGSILDLSKQKASIRGDML